MKGFSLAIISIIIMFGLVACQQSGADENKESPVPVEVTQPTFGDITLEKSVYGRTMPSEVTPLMTPGNGKVDEVKVENGDVVEEDDTIARINTPAGRRDLQSPADGRVTQLTLKEDDPINPEEAFAVIANIDTLTAQFSLVGDVRDFLEKGSDYKGEISGEEKTLTLTRRDIMPNKEGLYTVEAEFSNEDGAILPGDIIKMNIPTNTYKDVYKLPTESVIKNSDDAFIWVVENELVHKQDVTIIVEKTDITGVKGDLNEDTDVVTRGMGTLQEDDHVRIVKAGNPS